MILSFIKADDLIKCVNNNNYTSNDTILFTGDLDERFSQLDINCNFSWFSLYNIKSTAHGLPRTVAGNLQISNITLKTCEGMPERIGGITMNGTCFVESWSGFENTMITTDNFPNRVSLPKEFDLKYHPHSNTRLTRLSTTMPAVYDKYIGSELLENYRNNRTLFEEYFKDLFIEDFGKNLLETI